MARYTDDQKADAVDRVLEVGMAQAHEELGIPKATMSRWLTPEQHEELAQRFQSKTSAATATHAADMASRRTQLAADLLDDVQKLRDQLFAPCTERKVVTLSGGLHAAGEWEIVDVERDQPTFVEQKAIMTTLAIAVDKVQVLTGEATERIEHRQVPERTPEQEAEMDRTLRLVRDQAA